MIHWPPFKVFLKIWKRNWTSSIYTTSIQLQRRRNHNCKSYRTHQACIKFKEKTLPQVKELLDLVIIILHNVICVFKIHEIIHHVLFLNLWNIQWKLLNCHLAAIDICMKYVIDSWRNKNWKSGFPLYVCLGLSFHLKNNNELYAIKCDCVCLI